MTGGRRWYRGIGLIIAMLLLLPMLLTPMTVYGVEVDLRRVAAEDEEIYRYEFPNGLGVETTIPMGSSDQMITIFAFDEGIEYQMYRDGEQIVYSQDDLLMEDGDYVLHMKAQDYTATFEFSLSGSAEEYDISFGSIVTVQKLDGGYSHSKQRFVYTFPNGASVTANIPIGNISSSHVTFSFSGAVSGTLLKDDAPADFTVGETISEEGVYRLSLTAMPDITDATEGTFDDMETTDTNIYKADFCFRILSSPCSDMGVYNPPQDFEITGVSLDGKAAEFSSDYCLLDKDGSYSFQLRHKADSSVTGKASLQIDRLAPYLTFPQGGAGGEAEGTVLLRKSEESAEVTILKDQEPYLGDPTKLTDPGYYQITIRDEAGNQREYRLRLTEAFHFSWTTLVIILLIAAAVVVAIAVFARRNMRVI